MQLEKTIKFEKLLFPFDNEDKKTDDYLSYSDYNSEDETLINNIEKAKYASVALNHVGSLSAYAVNLPVRFLDFSKLENIQTLINDLLNNKLIKKNYSDQIDQFKQEKIDFEKISKSMCEYADKVIYTVNEKYKEETIDKKEENKIKWVESKIKDIFDQFKNDGNQPSIPPILLNILPLLERKIWYTRNLNPLTFHHICRHSSIWKLLILCWMYQNRTKFSKCLKEEYKLASIPFLGNICMCVHTIKLNDTAIGFVGPFYNVGDKIYNHLPDFYRATGFKLQIIYKVFNHLLNSELEKNLQEIEKQTIPDNNEIYDALISRLPYSNNEIEYRVKQFSVIFTNLLNTEIDSTLKPNYINRQNICLVASWLGYNQEIFKKIANKGTKYHFVCENKEQGIKLLIAQKKPPIILQILQKKQLDSIYIYCCSDEQNNTNIKNIEELINSNNTNQKSLQRIESPNILLNRIKERMALSISYKIRALGNCMHSFFAENNEQRILQKIGSFIGESLIDITHAHLCSILAIDYATPYEKLNEDGFYSEIIPFILEKDNLEDNLNAVYDKLNTDGDHKSSVFRCIQKKQSLIIYDLKEDNSNDSEDGNSVVYYYPKNFRPKSSLSVPLLFNGRVIGVIQIRGITTEQFSEFDLSSVIRVSQILSPYFYQHKLLHALNNISSYFSNYYTHSSEETNKLKEISQELNQIFLCSATHLWLQDKINLHEFELIGYSDDTGIENENKTCLFDYTAQNPKDFQNKFVHFLNYKFLTEDINGQMFIPQNEHNEYVLAKTSLDNNSETTTDKSDPLTGQIELCHDFISHRHENEQQINKEELAKQFPEWITFGLSTRIDKSSTRELIGFIIMYNKYEHLWNKEWGNVVSLVNQYITQILKNLDIVNNPVKQARNIIEHEMRQKVISIEYLAKDKMKPTAEYLSNEINRLLHSSLSIYNIQNIVLGSTDEKNQYLEFLNSLSENEKYQIIKFMHTVITNKNSFALPNQLVEDVNELDKISIKLETQNPSTEFVFLAEILLPILAGYKKELSKNKSCYVFIDNQSKTRYHFKRNYVNRIIVNLMNNVIKYTEKNESVDITITNTKISIINTAFYDKEIADNPNTLKKKGYRSPLVINKKIDGEGLGLSIVDQICKTEKWKFDIKHSPLNRYNKNNQQLGLYQISVDFKKQINTNNG